MSEQEHVRGRVEPEPSRLQTEESYGVPESGEGMLSWGHVKERMSSARNYWLATVRPDGRPHSVPVWGIWLDGTFYFSGGRRTRKARNLETNPHVVVHLESGDDVVILEGVAEEITDPSLLTRIDDAYEANYVSATAPRSGPLSSARRMGGMISPRPQPAGCLATADHRSPSTTRSAGGLGSGE